MGLITALMWQPLQTNPADDERLLASGGDDGIISIWNARVPENKAKCSMTMGPPVVALAFTPDGAFIAGATTEQILIWKVGDHAIPRASWSRQPHPGWYSPKVNGEAEEEDTYTLGWDSTGQRLAYGANSRACTSRLLTSAITTDLLCSLRLSTLGEHFVQVFCF
jgi:transducin (beta)-like 1